MPITIRKRTAKEIHAYAEGYHAAINDVLRILNKDTRGSARNQLNKIINDININLIAIDSVVYDASDRIKQ